MTDPTEVYVPRDYSHGMEPTCFDRVIPRELEERVSEHDFLTLVDTINEFYNEAETVGWGTFAESMLGCLSCYSIFICYKSKDKKNKKKKRKKKEKKRTKKVFTAHLGTYKRAMERMTHFLKVQNATVFLPKGIRVKNPLYNGNLHLEFVVYPLAQNGPDGL
jgi:hypothetical protein